MLAEELKELGARRELIRMAERGQLLRLRCEMPICYREYERPGGRQLFDAWPNPKQDPKNKWSPNPDHYPLLNMDGGKLDPWNIRLAHVFCNNIDFSRGSESVRYSRRTPRSPSNRSPSE